MRRKKVFQPLSKKEKEVMRVLWNSSTPLVASQINNIDLKLNINTVQAVLKKLLLKEYIKIADIVYSGTVLTRSYEPTISIDEYVAGQLKYDLSDIGNISKLGVIAAFLEIDEEEKIEKLNAMIKELNTED